MQRKFPSLEVIICLDNHISLPKKELQQLINLEHKCFSRKEVWSMLDMETAIGQKSAVLVRQFDEHRNLIAFQIANINKRALVTVDVSPEHRNCGLGKRLLRKTLSILKKHGVDEVYCHIRTTNIPSLNLHMRNGFIIVRYINNYYYRGAHAFELKKNMM